MKRNKAQNISDLVLQFLRLSGLETPLNEHRLIQAWSDVLGPQMSKYTDVEHLYIKNQKLYVHVTSAALRQELSMARSTLVKTLNNRVGSQVIVDIIFN
ncbi:MAG: DUF721 domain-containing protein [Phocaeicola sp.]|jgi:predicted nucleic acid-binding Zn ribbon protein|nr:DUF721 domain-containing protein [Phocaeicola sp.]